MNTVELTDAEREVIARALSNYNDFVSDTFLENVSFNFYPRGENVSVLSQEHAGNVRDELSSAMEHLSSIRTAMSKFGVGYDPKTGYSK